MSAWPWNANALFERVFPNNVVTYNHFSPAVRRVVAHPQCKQMNDGCVKQAQAHFAVFGFLADATALVRSITHHLLISLDPSDDSPRQIVHVSPVAVSSKTTGYKLSLVGTT